MTVVAAIHDSKTRTTWVGSDTISHYLGCRVPCVQKWHINGEWAVGLAGDHRAHSLLEHHSDRLFRDLSGPQEFTARVYAVFKEADFDLKPAAGCVPPNCGQEMLLANHNGVWIVAGDFSFLKAPGFWAQGAGCDIALGAATAARKLGETNPQTILTLAIEAAIELSTGCGGEPWVEKVGP